MAKIKTKRRAGDPVINPAWLPLFLIIVLICFVLGSMALFVGTFERYVPATLTSHRSGLVMEPGAKIKLRGVEVGRVGEVKGGKDAVSLKLEFDPSQTQYIPANIEAEIRATTAFGAKYVNLLYPSDPSPKHLTAGQVIQSRNVSTEVNTVFENLTSVLQKIDVSKLNSVLTALAEGLRGQGNRIGEGITAGNEVLQQINPRSEAVRRDFRALKGFSDAYGAAAQDIVTVLDAASTTSKSISDNAANLEAVLIGVAGFSQSGIELLGQSKDNLVRAINVLEPTTSLLLKYDPSLTCLLQGGLGVLDGGFLDYAGGKNGYSAIVDAALLLGDDPYKYPDNLPIIGGKGGPGGKPGCAGLPDVSKNWPVRYLVTNSGWGGGVEVRPNPGIGFPGYANYFPGTRAVPEPPSIRNRNGPAPGPIPYPGAPAYGARQYAPDGTPLYPGLPPAPPPGAPRDPRPAPGVEPFEPPFPGFVTPTPLPHPSPPPPPPPPLVGPPPAGAPALPAEAPTP